MREQWCSIIRASGVPILMMLAVGAHAGAPVFVSASATSFDRPHDVVLSVDGKHLYVADIGNDVVKVLDADTLATVGEIGRGELDNPHDVALDARGRLLVADTGNDRIAIYAIDGTKGKLAGTLSGRLRSPEGVVADGEQRVYATSAGADNVVLFVDGKVAAERRDLGLRRPHDIDIDVRGLLHIVDPGNKRIVVVDRDLMPVRVLAGSPFDFNEPKYLAFDEAGRLYVADEHNHQVKIFDRDYRLLWTIGTGRSGKDPGMLRKPEGVAARGGRVWIADTYNDRIVLYRLP